MTTYRRAISTTESLYLLGDQLAPPFAIQLVVAGRGTIDLSTLRQAVGQAGQACPGARLVARRGKWVASADEPMVLEAALDPADGQPLEESSMLRRKLNLSNGPSAEVVLMSGDTTQLLFRVSHAVMDGQGALMWIEQVFRALRDELLEPAQSTLTEDQLLRQQRSRVRRPAPRTRHPSPIASVAPTSVNDCFFLRRVIEGSHPSLVAKLASVISSAAQISTCRFMVPVDLRRHLERTVRSTANLTRPLFVDVKPDQDWQAVHQRLLAALAEHHELASDWTEAWLSLLPVSLVHGLIRMGMLPKVRRGKYLATAILSHLGRIQLNSFSAPGFRAQQVWSYPVHSPLFPLSLVAVQNPDGVQLTAAGARTGSARSGTESLMDSICEALAPVRRWQSRRSEPQDRQALNRQTVHQMIEQRARKHPESVALICPDRHISYGELNQRATEVAVGLIEQGAKTGDIIGLLGDRTPETMIAMLGILKAGAAYLPLDPSTPDTRMISMLHNVRANCCLVQDQYVERIQTQFHGQVAGLELRATRSHSLPTGDPGDLAYVIFTSGSTGAPRGVPIRHQNLVNYLCWAQHQYDINDKTCFALFTSLAFDLSVTSFWLPIISGGSTALFSESFDRWTIEQVFASQANALKLTPTHLQMITQSQPARRQMHTVIVGGEQLTTATANRARQLLGDQCRIFNEYGPTEATVGCTAHQFDAHLDSDQVNVPIGKPGDQMGIHLVDRHRREVPAGNVGEIAISGRGLADGYLGDSGATAEKFVTLEDGTRIYCTGDLGQARSDGALMFLSRIDDQIKIHGYRIEPGEIEAALCRLPQVQEAVVLARSHHSHGGQTLCAFVVTEHGNEEASIRQALRKYLPSYMVPEFITAIDQIPTTVNGKVDVRALPEIEQTNEEAVPAAIPRDSVEEAVSVIWQRVLRLDKMPTDPEADFHQLGGDSLTLLEMLVAVQRDVVGKEHGPRFVQQSRDWIARPTLGRVARMARLAMAEPESTMDDQTGLNGQ